MKIRLTQIDGKFPNLALMKLSHWHKSQGHQVFFEKSVSKSFFEPEYDIVYGSSIFTTSKNKIDLFKLQFPNAIVGGTGTNDNETTVEKVIQINDYEHYDYDIYPDFDASIGFSQRGCRLRCKFCVVPLKEGKNVNSNTIYDIWKGNPRNKKKKIHLLDNDFFGQPGWKEKATEIIDGEYKICFNQGINIRLIDEEGAEYLSKMKYMDDSFKAKRIYTAWDNKRDENIFMKGINALLSKGIKPDEIMVYFLCNYWEKGLTEDVWHRFNVMAKLGLKPYPMIYEKWNASKELKEFQTWVIRGRYKLGDLEKFFYENKKKHLLNRGETIESSIFESEI
jgi:hypothetical protein